MAWERCTRQTVVAAAAAVVKDAAGLMQGEWWERLGGMLRHYGPAEQVDSS